jgi:hypothetical protein
MSSKTLFHYTTFEGLKGILEENCFRANDAYTTNDSQEIVHGINLINRYLDESVEKEAIKEKVREFTDDLIGKERPDKLARGVFLTCFSSYDEDADKNSYDFNNGLLSQWRGYGLKQGYALKFDSDLLLKAFESESRKDKKDAVHTSGDVTYCNIEDFLDKEDNKKSFGEMTKSIGKFKTNPSGFSESREEQELFESILKICFHNKHEGFSEEREHRVVKAIWENKESIKKYDVFFYEGCGGLVRSYVKILEGKPRMALKEIIVGPSPNKEINKIQIESFLKQIGSEIRPDVKVEISATPFV